MIGSEHHFRTSFGSARATSLLNTIKSSTDKARATALKLEFVEARTEPTVAYDLTLAGLAEFETYAGISKEKVNGQHLWIIDETYALRIKKLRPGYQSSNHASSQQDLIKQFLPLDGLGPLIYVTAGAVYSDVTGLVGQIVVVKHVASKSRNPPVEWVVDLAHLAVGGTDPTALTLPIFDDPPEIQSAPATVIPRKNRKTSEEGSG